MFSFSSATYVPTSKRFSAIIDRAGLFLLALFIALHSASHSQAAILSFSGDLVVISPPTAVTLSSLEDDLLAKLFVERQSVLLNEALLVDVSVPGVVRTRSDLSPATFVNQAVNSYLLHADPVRAANPEREYRGSITFEEDILGLIVTRGSLDESDLLLGSDVTGYIPPDPDRGIEGTGFRAYGLQINDSVELTADLRTVLFHFKTTSRLDQVRIITSATVEGTHSEVPEPPSIALLIAGLLLWKKIARRKL